VSKWPLAIDGHDYQPIPESWIRYGHDDRDGDGPQLLAVSAATWRGSVKVRYAHPYGRRVGQIIEPANSGDDGLYPQRLADHDWPRSIAASRLEPVGDVRMAERRHLHDLWSERARDVLDEHPDVALDDERLVADGGQDDD
jgi:hypothetical protein